MEAIPISVARSPRSTARALVAAVRPVQWVKNGVMLVPAVFAMKALDPVAMLRALGAAGTFCVLSSAIYLVNDILDREQDRAHPEKRNRPVASGDLSPALAVGIALAFAAAALAAGRALGWPFLVAVVCYLVLQAAYCTFLKRVAVMDVFAIAGGFVLRVVGGAEAVDVPISNWLYLTTLFLALFLALEKRRAELTLLGERASQHRGILAEYSVGLLDQLVAITGGATVLTYSLYTLAPETIQKFGTDRLKLTIPFVLLGVCRYLFLVHRHGLGGQPERVLVRDPGMQLTILGYVATVAWAIYTVRP